MATPLMLQSPRFSAFSTPKKVFTSQSYIISLAALPNHYAAAISAPSNTIEIYDKSTVERIQILSGHDNAITSLRVAENLIGVGSKHLISSGKDGSVKVWDNRTNSHSIKLTDLGKARPLLCCDVSFDGFTVAAGTELHGEDASIIYWDPRQPAAPLRTHSSTHSDDVTVVSFAASSIPGMKVLLSASSDGLISTSNSEEDDEDEAVLNVGNWGCSVAQAGWIYNTTGLKIWASSDMETFSTWTDELEKLQDLDIRAPSIHDHGTTWVTDYLVGCKPHPSVPGGLGIFVGSNEGDIALISNEDWTAGAPWQLHTLWGNGHVGVVRSVLWDETANVVVTGGEDGKINFWPSELEDTEMEMDVDQPVRKREADWGPTDDDQEGKRHKRG
ncbi:WD40 repeat-like protein [Pluteus cervinus]|uniref:WD40 repeat-like protein n=1 Tax=Pluteus cervinus TaxID=181527 RepID=A0ACD3B976_9AGAR|nr:WD40 repeat-like protein [Pluteus cervinus]